MLPSRAGIPIALLPVVLSGCVALTPFDTLAEQVGPERYLEADGHRIFVEDRGRGEAIVFVPGLGGSVLDWREIATPLAASYRTIALDLYGFGFTERPADPARYSRSGQIGLILAVMDALGVERAHLAGHSYGGGIVLTLAHQHPERVRSLVLVGSTWPGFAAKRRPVLHAVGPLARPFARAVVLRRGFLSLALRRAYFNDALIDAERVDAILERLRVEGLRDAYRGLTRAPSTPADLATVELAGILHPALLVWGEQDRMVPLRRGRRQAAALADARLEVLPRTGHMVMVEQPAQLVERMVTFLARLGPEEPEA